MFGGMQLVDKVAGDAVKASGGDPLNRWNGVTRGGGKHRSERCSLLVGRGSR